VYILNYFQFTAINLICSMFTGIIEQTGRIVSVDVFGTNKTFWIESAISGELTPDQSVSHNGVCLTVEEVKDGMHRVTAVQETLNKTTLGSWKQGDVINLERSMTLSSRLDGHLVQGHTDAAATCTSIIEKEGSWVFQFRFPEKFATLLVEKGSVAVNGTSLTVFNVTNDCFEVTIIPYTYNFTNFHQLQKNEQVNIEFDIIGKYVLRNQQINKDSYSN
jgi:riboflavin synthase